MEKGRNKEREPRNEEERRMKEEERGSQEEQGRKREEGREAEVCFIFCLQNHPKKDNPPTPLQWLLRPLC